MKFMRKLIAAVLRKKRRAYWLELPVGDELSDGDRAKIYGWPDVYVSSDEKRD